MRFFFSTDVWTKAILAALAISPVACGSSTETTPGTGGKASVSPCKDAQPVLAQGKDTGYEACTGQWKHRPEIVECPSALPRTSYACSFNGSGGGPTGGCVADADCTEKPNGYCDSGDGNSWGCYCNYGCVKDADCGAGQICVCGETIGHCASASCKSDADCVGGLCATYVTTPGCGGTNYACQNDADVCTGDGDCPQGQQCTISGGHRVCQEPQCAIGRPFLIAGEERLAPLAARADWQSGSVAPCLDGLDEEVRAALAARWARVAAMEHASVGAFARFVLQLLALGAPADLVRDAQTAMVDETRHAEICFALAGAYAGAPIGPGPLAIDRALEGCDARSALITTILEGCVGETVAAIEAAETAARAEDPVVRAALEGIAADEGRHAELAWRFVRWTLGAHPHLAGAAREAFAAALSERGGAHDADEGALIAHGLAGEGLRRAIRARALAGVVGPCAAALLASLEKAAPESVALHA